MYYPSKKDRWLGVLFLGIITACIFVFYYETSYIIKSIDILLVIIIIWVWFDTGYTISKDDKIIIKTGPIRGKIDIKKIVKVKRTKNYFSSASLSLECLKIVSNTNIWNAYWFISPRAKKAFIDELRKRNPRIEFDI